jgi:hypothetical protein
MRGFSGNSAHLFWVNDLKFFSEKFSNVINKDSSRFAVRSRQKAEGQFLNFVSLLSLIEIGTYFCNLRQVSFIPQT